MFWNSTETWAMLQKMKTSPSRKRPYIVLDVGEPHSGEYGVREPHSGEYGTREPHVGESGTREPHVGESGTAECREGVPNTDISPDSTTQVAAQSDVSEKTTTYGINYTVPVEGFKQCKKDDVSCRERLVLSLNKCETPEENSHDSGSTGAGSVFEKFEEKRNDKNKGNEDSDQSTLRVETNLLDEVGQNSKCIHTEVSTHMYSLYIEYLCTYIYIYLYTLNICMFSMHVMCVYIRML